MVRPKINKKLAFAEGVIEAAVSAYKPSAIFALFSGGHDSLTATHFAASVLGDRMTGVAHINTGIGIPQTRQFVRETCKQFGWELKEYKATENTKADGTPNPMLYKELVLKHGFPGPVAHRQMYNQLKERQLRRLVREHKNQRADKVLLISGVRLEESIRRMGHVTYITHDGARIWTAPLARFTTDDQREYMRRHQLPENPVKKLLCMSGECLCGAFARKGELEEIRLWFPKVAARIDRLNEAVLAAGHKHKWGQWKPKEKGEKKEKIESLPLCVSCPAKLEMEDA